MIIDNLGEFDLIARLTEKISTRNTRVVRGVGDDAAVLKMSDSKVILATCDSQIEGIHFTLDGFSAKQIGIKAAAVNLSDIASMGGVPLFALVSLGVPGSLEVSFLEEIYGGMAGEFGKWGVEIVGGNTARIPDRIVVDVTLLGDVRPDECLLRSGAQAGDLLCVTGSLGASRAGLELLEGAELGISEFAREEAIRKHCMPSPRLREGQLLGSTGKVTSCMDISDGLWGDAVHIARESDVTVRIDLTRIPVAVSAAQIAGFIGEDPGQFALKGGEDFELLFTVSKASAEDVMLLLRRETDTPVTIIGDIINGDPRVTVQNLGETLNSSPGSFEHFYGEGFDD